MQFLQLQETRIESSLFSHWQVSHHVMQVYKSWSIKLDAVFM